MVSNLAFVFLFSAKTRIYKQNTHTHTQNGSKKLSISILTDYYKSILSFLSRVSRAVSQGQCISQFQLRPAPPPPAPGYCGAFAAFVSPGGGAFANFALPGGREFANPGAIPEHLSRTRFPIRIQLHR